MTEQHALWVDPHWSDAFELGDRVLSTYTGNRGVVTGIEPRRHLLIEWEAWRSPLVDREPYVVRHSSPLGLSREGIE